MACTLQLLCLQVRILIEWLEEGFTQHVRPFGTKKISGQAQKAVIVPSGEPRSLITLPGTFMQVKPPVCRGKW